MQISVIIIAKNEAEMIGECIDSLSGLDPTEILVVDDHSSDGTVSISRYKGAKVVTHKMSDFGAQREFAATQVKSDWILYIDADERMSKELSAEIKDFLLSADSSSYSACKVRRVNYYLGKKWPKEEFIARLFSKKELKGWKGVVHETAVYAGEAKVLAGALIHLTHRNLQEMVENTLSWSDHEAKLRFAAHHPPVVAWRIFRVMLTAFIDYYVTQGGWRVGTVGLIESMYQSFSMFITYARLWELQIKVK